MLAGRSRDWSISTEGCSWSSGDVHQGDPAVDPRVSASGVSCGDLCKPGLGVERLRDYPGNPASADEAAGDASRRQIQAIKPMQRPTAPKGGGKGTCHNCIPAPAEEDPAGRPAGAEGTEGPTSPAADKAQLEEAMKAQSDEAKVRNEKGCGPSWGRVGDYRASAPSFWSWPCFFGWTSARRTRPRPSRGWGNRPATPSFADAGSNSDTPRPKMASRTSGPMDFAPKTRLARQEVEEEAVSEEEAVTSDDGFRMVSPEELAEQMAGLDTCAGAPCGAAGALVLRHAARHRAEDRPMVPLLHGSPDLWNPAAQPLLASDIGLETEPSNPRSLRPRNPKHLNTEPRNPETLNP